jgi:Fe-S-cluster containining protein
MTEHIDSSGTTVKTFTLKVETPDGALPPAQVQVPDLPMGLADIVPPMYQLCDGVTALAVRRSESEGNKLSCGPGCGVCCRQLVPVSIPEAIFLAQYVMQLPADRSTQLQRFFSDAISRIGQAGLLDKLQSIDDREDGAEIALEYFRLGIACPFLTEDSCGIHPFRPCACREFNVTSPAQCCADPLQGKIERIPLHRKMTTALALTAARLLGTKPALIPFPLILHWYERYQKYAELRWKGIGLFELMLAFGLGQNSAESD